MKILIVLALVLGLSGCVVEPVGGYHRAYYYQPAVVIPAPYYSYHGYGRWR
jgi:hypothetical protein